MNIEKRKFYRIFTTTNFKFGPEKRMSYRQINLSAGGAAFQVPTNYFKALSIGDRISFEIEIMDDHHKLDGEVVRMMNANNKNMVAIRFVEIQSDFQQILNTHISSIGGYFADDLIARYEYLKRNYPEMVS